MLKQHPALAIAALVALSACQDLGQVGNSAPEVTSTPVAPIAFDAVFVVNAESSSISVINAETDVVSGTIALTGIRYPHHVYLSPDRSLLSVAVPGFDMSGGGLGHGAHASSNRGYVLLLDATTGAMRKAVRTDAANSNAAFLPGTGQQVWTSQGTVPGTTLVMDTTTLEVRDAISVGTSPSETTFSADGRLAFVANAGSASVSVIDVAGRRILKTIAVGNGPVGAWPLPSGFTYVTNEGDFSISVIDPTSLEAVRTIPLTFAPGMIAAPNSSEIWVTVPERGELEVRDSNGAVLRTVRTGRGTHGIAFATSSTKAYVSNAFENTVSVVDRSSMQVMKTIPVGASPNGLVWRSK